MKRRLSKPALVFVEGSHRDNKGKYHQFSQDRVLTIVENSNRLLQGGHRIPFQLDHKLTQDYNLGDVESPFVARPITQEDASKAPALRSLVGRLGVFTDRVVAKTEKAVKDISRNAIKTLSAGICPVREAIIEISATPFPAIVGPTLFSSYADGEDLILFEDMASSAPAEDLPDVQDAPAYSMEEALGMAKERDHMLEDYQTLSSALWKTLYSLYTASEAELQGLDPFEASYNAMEFFLSEVEVLFELVDTQDTQY